MTLYMNSNMLHATPHKLVFRVLNFVMITVCNVQYQSKSGHTN